MKLDALCQQHQHNQILVFRPYSLIIDRLLVSFSSSKCAFLDEQSLWTVRWVSKEVYTMCPEGKAGQGSPYVERDTADNENILSSGEYWQLR